ncbi:MAG: hypothetical protein JO131_04305 [Gammaproteobacteria bacterium]|nr:hypothetical protein [Gammaproteobacteria bacterium]
MHAGIEVFSLNEKEMTYEFNSIDALKDFLSASMANIKQIPILFKEEFLEDFCIEFLKQSNCNNNHKIPLSFWCLEVFGSKKGLQKTKEIKDEAMLGVMRAKL